MSTATMNIHGVVSIVKETIHFGTFVSHQFTFTDDKGGRVVISAFAAEALEMVENGQRECHPSDEVTA
jgi:hypothetical protein